MLTGTLKLLFFSSNNEELFKLLVDQSWWAQNLKDLQLWPWLQMHGFFSIFIFLFNKKKV